MRKNYWHLIWLLLAGSCFAQIAGAPGGSCTGTTSCTLSGTPTAKSLQIAFAFRTATTAPSTPAGWTSIASANGTSSSYKALCRVSATAASGTFTNATNVVILWYGATAAHATSDCNTTGVGNTLATTAGASTTASYGGIAVSRTYNRVVGFLGGSASSLCTPSGLTSIATTGTVVGNDSGSNLSSWATTTCSVSSENWISYVLEVLGAQDQLTPPQVAVVPVDYYIDLQGNTTLANDTTAVCIAAGACTPLVNGTHSSKAITWTTNAGTTFTTMLLSRQNVCPRNYDYYVRGDQVYPRTRPWRSIRIDHGNAAGTGGVNVSAAGLAMPAGASQASVTGCLSLGAQACTAGGTLVDFVQFQGALTGRSSTLQFDCGQGATPARPGFNIESGLTGSTVHSNYVIATPGRQYRFALFVDYVSGVQKAILWDPNTLTIVGEMSLAQVVGVAEYIGNLNLGQNEAYTNANCTGCQGNTYSYLEDIAMDFTSSLYQVGPGWNDGTLWKSAAVGVPGMPSIFGIAVQ